MPLVVMFDDPTSQRPLMLNSMPQASKTDGGIISLSWRKSIEVHQICPQEKLLSRPGAAKGLCVAHILYLSAAGAYIDRILDDLDREDTLADGSTHLGYLTTLRVGGWWDGRIGAYWWQMTVGGIVELP